MEIKSVVHLGLSFLCVLSSQGQEAARRYTLTETDVYRALSVAGVAASITHLRIPRELTAEAANPSLSTEGVAVAGDHVLQVRLACKPSEDCLPFFATIEFADVEHTMQARDLLAAHTPLRQDTKRASKASLHAGDHTTLFLTSDHMQLTLPVVAIDSGAIGEEIRVASLDRKKVYRGRIADGKLVKGPLQ